jgi:hypothetical protein
MPPVTYAASTPGSPTFVLGHGAGAGQDHPWMVRVAQGLAARGVTVVTFNFPYTDAKKRLPDPAPVLEKAFATIWTTATSGATGRLFAGGKSMGGRIASQAAARHLLQPSPSGLLFFGYPLHPPGKPAQRRDRHLPEIALPLLFVQGSRDAFGTPDEMRALVMELPGATLEIIEDGDHSLIRPKRADPDGRAIDHALDVAAAWMRR